MLRRGERGWKNSSEGVNRLEEDGKMPGRIVVKLVRSGIGRPERQRRTLKGLGLTKLNREVILEDSAEVRGMIRKVAHLVRVEPLEGR